MLRDHLLAEPFLRQAAEEFPEFQPELARALSCYGEVKRLRAGMDDLMDDLFTQRAMQAANDAGIRREYANAILRICEAEEEAIHHIALLIDRCA